MLVIVDIFESRQRDIVLYLPLTLTSAMADAFATLFLAKHSYSPASSISILWNIKVRSWISTRLKKVHNILTTIKNICLVNSKILGQKPLLNYIRKSLYYLENEDLDLHVTSMISSPSTKHSTVGDCPGWTVWVGGLRVMMGGATTWRLVRADCCASPVRRLYRVHS